MSDDGRASFVGKKNGLVYVADGPNMIGPQNAVRGLRRGKSVAFVAVMPDGECVVEDGKPSERFDEVLEWNDGGPAGALSIHGEHVAYVVDAKGEEHLVRDGNEELVRYEAVLATSLGARDRFALVARRGADEVVVIDGIETGAWATAPIFSDEGAHWAYVASMGAERWSATPRTARCGSPSTVTRACGSISKNGPPKRFEPSTSTCAPGFEPKWRFASPDRCAPFSSLIGADIVLNGCARIRLEVRSGRKSSERHVN